MKKSDSKIIAASLVEHFGNSQTETAKALRVKQPSVNGWLKGKHCISAEVAFRAEVVTGGKFKAVEICPGLAA